MNTALTGFSINGLHGRPKKIEVPLSNNRLVLVGENGTGKSTVANLFYYLLTKQWRRIAEYRFTEIAVDASGDVVRFSHDDIERLVDAEQPTGITRELRHRYPSHVWRSLYHVAADEAVYWEHGLTREIVERASQTTGIPQHMAERFLLEYRDAKSAKLKKPLLQELKKLEAWQLGQFLYLPTYRRIEQDLKSIFRGIEIEEKVREFRERLRKRERLAYVELIEFGMEDVEKTLQSRMAQVKERVRTGLGTLTGTYLREVIRGLQDNPDLSVLRSTDLAGFESMFARIDEAILPAADKKSLQQKIADIAEGYHLGPDDKVIAHFLSKLVALYKEHQEHESDIRDFVRLCNEYLTGKQFVYDAVKYEIFIVQTAGDTGENAERLSLKALSSGEKQIISLFSHIYFSGETQFFVVIDEPELSLSVPWQQRFLPDIIRTERCAGLVAVTHSPFIWENALDPHVVSLAECIRST